MTLYCICVQTFVVTCANIIVIGTFKLFRNVFPEAICCCLQTCYAGVTLLLMDCVCILTFIVVTLLVVYIIMYGLKLFFNVKFRPSMVIELRVLNRRRRRRRRRRR